MNNPKLLELEKALEHMFPEPQKGFVTRLEATLLQQVSAPRQKSRRFPVTWRLATGFVLALIICTVLLLATPQGRTLAQSAWFYITRSESNTRPSSFGTTSESLPFPTPTYMPLRLLKLVPVVPTETPSPAEDPEVLKLIEVAAKQAGYQPLQFTQLPVGYHLWDASYSEEYKLTTLFYAYESKGMANTGMLFLMQSRQKFKEEVSPDATIKSVQINQNAGEYYQGGWEQEAGKTEQEWIEQPFVETILWQQNGYYFRLLFVADTTGVDEFNKPSYLDMEELVMVANSLGSDRLTQVTPLAVEYPDSSLSSVEMAEVRAGFELLQPMLLPEEFTFHLAGYSNSTVRLEYQKGSGGTAGLVIFETPLGEVADISSYIDNFPPDKIEAVTILGWAGRYVAGGISLEIEATLTPGPTATPVWQPDAPQRVLVWKTDTLSIVMIFYASPYYDGRLDREAMLRIAESMK
jgi:hypothetical protein